MFGRVEAFSSGEAMIAALRLRAKPTCSVLPIDRKRLADTPEQRGVGPGELIDDAEVVQPCIDHSWTSVHPAAMGWSWRVELFEFVANVNGESWRAGDSESNQRSCTRH